MSSGKGLNPGPTATISLVLPFNSLPNDKTLDWSKLKAFADDKIYKIIELKFGLESVENSVANGDNAGY